MLLVVNDELGPGILEFIDSGCECIKMLRRLVAFKPDPILD